MPTYKSLSLTLHSPQPIPNPLSNLAPASGGPLPEHPPPPSKPLVDHSTNTISVVIPTYPAQQFWLVYSFDSASLTTANDGKSGNAAFYVFKVYLNDREVVTFHVGPEQEWKGKCMFAIRSHDGKLGREVFVLERGMGEVVVKVFRGDKKVRVPRALVSQGDVQKEDDEGEEEEEELDDNGKKVGKGVRKMGGGVLGSAAPKRGWFYRLVDGLERPWMVVRFLCWDKSKCLCFVL
jgi:hypothetical protein